MPVQIRLQGSQDEIDQVLKLIQFIFSCDSLSHPYPNARAKGDTVELRQYLIIQPQADTQIKKVDTTTGTVETFEP